MKTNTETNKKTSVEQTETAEKIDYKQLYAEVYAKNVALEAKVTEYEKICKSFSEQAQKAQEALRTATLEYNARVDYMLDCVKHAYISIQLASNTPQKQGDN